MSFTERLPSLAMALLALLAAPSCMLGPHDQESVSPESRTTRDFVFHGYHALASERITIQAQVAGTAPPVYEPIPGAWTTSETTPVRSPEPEGYFRWRTTSTIPSRYWTPGNRGYEARVRATSPSAALMSVDASYLACWNAVERDKNAFAEECAAEVSPDARIRTTDYVPPVSVFAARCEPGDPRCAPCVRDVEQVFQHGRLGYRPTASGATEEGPTGRLRLDLRLGASLPPDGRVVTGAGGPHSHPESIVRVPGDGSASWLVMGRLRPEPDVPFYVFRVGSVPSSHDGGPLVPVRPSIPAYYDVYNRILADNETEAYVELDQMDHIGGMQAFGNIVAMPVQSPEGPYRYRSVYFYDFSVPADPRFTSGLTVSLGRTNVHWVAFHRMDNGRFLLLVNRTNSGIVTPYISDSGVIGPGTSWYRLPEAWFGDVSGWSDGTGTYQNANLVSDCGSGRLYLVAMRQLGTFADQWREDNAVDVFPLSSDGPDHVGLGPRVSRATFERAGDHCQMRGAAGLWVTPDHRPIVYCAARYSAGSPEALKVAEVTSN